jgi:hypothetical protein
LDGKSCSTGNRWKPIRRTGVGSYGKSISDYRRMSPSDNLPHPGGDMLAALGHGITIMVSGIFNGWRFEDVWLAR